MESESKNALVSSQNSVPHPRTLIFGWDLVDGCYVVTYLVSIALFVIGGLIGKMQACYSFPKKYIYIQCIWIIYIYNNIYVRVYNLSLKKKKKQIASQYLYAW